MVLTMEKAAAINGRTFETIPTILTAFCRKSWIFSKLSLKCDKRLLKKASTLGKRLITCPTILCICCIFRRALLAYPVECLWR